MKTIKDSKRIKTKIETNTEDKPTTSTKEETPAKKTTPNVSTPRNFTKKPSATDLYSNSKSKSTTSILNAQRKALSSARPSTKSSLKTSPSTTSFTSTKSTKSYNADVLKKAVNTSTIRKSIGSEQPRNAVERKKGSGDGTPRTAKDLPFVNVTVNSPPSQRKHANKLQSKEEPKTAKVSERHRHKTRTLTENEVKILTHDVVDNNIEMKNLNYKLSAKPKAFFVDFDDNKIKNKELKIERPAPSDVMKSSDDENYSYEDDFESYESDFESYVDSNSNNTDNEQDLNEHLEDDFEKTKVNQNLDEEKMLDSGSFDLRDAQKSANKVKPMLMQDIVEDSEDLSAGDDYKNKSSTTDEGFLDMSSSNTISSIKTVTHSELFDRPMLINFKKSKENKKKLLISERLKQRAKDILSMISLHQMSYTLYEMKPIPYDVYMATFGKSNHVQAAVQTYDDGVDKEIQTEYVELETKWTQNPVKFSTDDIYLNNEASANEKTTNSIEDLVLKFSFSVDKKPATDVEEEKCDDEYKRNPLRILFEQKDGVGKDVMLPVKEYTSKIKNTNFSVNRLRKFMKRVENRVSNILTANAGNAVNNFVKSSKISFSKGYLSLPLEEIYLKNRKVSGVVFSETKSNLFMTIHKKEENIATEKCLVCLWDVSVANLTPLKVMVAIENVTLCRFRGSTDGIFISALDDGSIHLWDLSEEPTWRDDRLNNKSIEEPNENKAMKTQTELDKEWDWQNSDVFDQEVPQYLWRASAYTSSAYCILDNTHLDLITALEFLPQQDIVNQDGGRRILGQICSLQSKGVLTIWTVIQEKYWKTTRDIGRAYWSKIKLEKYQTINLLDHIDIPIENGDKYSCFNMSIAKKRILNKRLEKEFINNRDRIRVKSASSDDSSVNVATNKRNTKGLSEEKKQSFPESWEFGVLCNDLKITFIDKVDYYLIARNCGEVLLCTRTLGFVKVNTLSVTNESTTLTTIEISPQHQRYFLIGTDSGFVHLCSILEARVLLTLDCKSTSFATAERCMADERGRFLGSIVVKPLAFAIDKKEFGKLRVNSIQWCRTNPCCIFTLTQDGVVREWDLLRSDIHPRGCSAEGLGLRRMCLSSDAKVSTMAILTAEGDVQIHNLSNKPRNKEQQELFNKYVSLL